MRRQGGRKRSTAAKKGRKNQNALVTLFVPQTPPVIRRQKKLLKRKKAGTAKAATKLLLGASKRGRGCPSAAEVSARLPRSLPASARSVNRLLGPRAAQVRQHREATRLRRLRTARRIALMEQEACLRPS